MQSSSTGREVSSTAGGRRITWTEQRTDPWAGGSIREIYVYPPSARLKANDFEVWIGTATIDRDADYSYFPNVKRLHMPITGNGIKLHFRDPEETVELAVYEQYSFDGARPLHARLIDGAISAFNLICKNDVQATAMPLLLDRHGLTFPLSISKADSESRPAETRTLIAVYAVSGLLTLRTQAGDETIIDSGDAFVAANVTGHALTLYGTQAQSMCIVAEIHL